MPVELAAKMLKMPVEDARRRCPLKMTQKGPSTMGPYGPPWGTMGPDGAPWGPGPMGLWGPGSVGPALEIRGEYLKYVWENTRFLRAA